MEVQRTLTASAGDRYPVPRPWFISSMGEHSPVTGKTRDRNSYRPPYCRVVFNSSVDYLVGQLAVNQCRKTMLVRIQPFELSTTWLYFIYSEAISLYNYVWEYIS